MFNIDKRSADPPFEARETLRAWQEKNHPWLELSDVHKETTENIRVTVTPFYMGCRESQSSTVFWVGILIETNKFPDICFWTAQWRYCIRLENLGELSVQLRERHWRIFSLSGTLETVRGRGVIGQVAYDNGHSVNWHFTYNIVLGTSTIASATRFSVQQPYFPSSTIRAYVVILHD